MKLIDVAPCASSAAVEEAIAAAVVEDRLARNLGFSVRLWAMSSEVEAMVDVAAKSSTFAFRISNAAARPCMVFVVLAVLPSMLIMPNSKFFVVVPSSFKASVSKDMVLP